MSLSAKFWSEGVCADLLTLRSFPFKKGAEGKTIIINIKYISNLSWYFQSFVSYMCYLRETDIPVNDYRASNDSILCGSRIHVHLVIYVCRINWDKSKSSGTPVVVLSIPAQRRTPITMYSSTRALAYTHFERWSEHAGWWLTTWP